MVPDTVLPVAERTENNRAFFWRRSLTHRILAVNIFVVLLLAVSLFYLDGLRRRLVDERLAQSSSEAVLIASAIDNAPPSAREALIGELGSESGARIRLFDAENKLISDSWRTSGATFVINSAAEKRWQRDVARWLDDAVDFVVDADTLPRFTGFYSVTPGADRVTLRLAPDRTHIFSAQAHLPHSRMIHVLIDKNARDIRRIVRADRSTLGYLLLATIALSVLLSLYLGRTIVGPLRALSRAATRVRVGRDREVMVPRLPSRIDEIGTLARAISDMSHALRQQIDATAMFAADVAHELKNPLASLNSAVETLRSVDTPVLRDQLQDIIGDDVRRLDRLISDISELSRIDARLSRVKFESIDVADLIASILSTRHLRNPDASVPIAFARPSMGATSICGEPAQISRVIENIIDNAVSFSPPGATVRVATTRDGNDVVIMVDDDGPGIPENRREAIFERFHSDRPEGEAFGQHSGLGLAIARAIVNGHDGSINVAPRGDSESGTRFIIRIPAYERQS